jgi:hypothetical protein
LQDQPGAASDPATTSGPVGAAKPALTREEELEAFIRAHEKDAPTLLGRLGLAARVAIYVVIAALMLEVAAVGHSSAEADTQGAFVEVGRQPGGALLLLALAIGLAAYAAWRLMQLATGSSRDEGLRPRLVAGAIGLVYLVLFVDAVRLIWSNSGRDTTPEPIVAAVLRWPGGAVLLGIGAVLLGLAGVVFAVWGIRRNLVPVLHRERMSGSWWRGACISQSFGDIGRAAVLCLISAALLTAALDDQPHRAKSVDQLLATLRHYPGGPALIVVLAIAFLSFAAFSAVEVVWGRY